MKQAPSSPPVPGNLPRRLDAFVGRDHDVVRLTELLDNYCLVTLTGGPGMGKTRLATELARTVLVTHPDGVWLVPLAPVNDPDLVSRAVASTLGVSDQSTRPLAEALVTSIGDHHTLIVLDNCEHVLGACASLAASLIASCPNLTIVATSQERLATAGEHVWAVSGLTVPEAMAESDGVTATSTAPAPPTEAAALSELTAASAVRLFEERARAALHTFAIDHDNVEAVVDICRRLDGIPLAIELAAARVNGFSPPEIARHLDDRFAFLTGGDRAGLPRHQTLRAAVDWSYDLLSEPEQMLLRRLSVFAGGATLDAVAAVCGANATDALDIVTALVARSLVVADAARSGADRYRLLETIRFYGRDRLVEAGELPTLAARHIEWCIRLAESAEAELNGPNQRTWLDRLEADHDNLRSALAWSIEHDAAEDALRLAGALAMFWRINSHFAEGHDWLDRVLAVTVVTPGPAGGAGAEDEPAAARDSRPGSVESGTAPILAKALWGKGLLALMVSNFGAAGPAAQWSLTLYRDLDDPRGIARSLLLLGCGAVGTSPNNVVDLQRSIVLAREAGDHWCLAYALAMCGTAINDAGDFAAARSVLEESITIARSSHDRQCLNFGLISLGLATARQGDYQVAEPLLEEVLATTDTPYELAVALTELAGIAVQRLDYDRAHSLLERAAHEHRLAPLHGVADLMFVEARLALAEGDLDGAEHLFTRSVDALRAAGAVSSTAVHGLGDVALARGDAAGALALFNEALAMAGPTGSKREVASILYSMGNAYRLDGDLLEATSMHRQALDMRVEAEDARGILVSAEALAGLSAGTGQVERATRVLACAQATRDRLGYARSPAESTAYDADKAAAAEALDPVAFDAAWAKGTSMAIEAAVALVASAKRSRGGRSATGATSLTDAERQVARLVLQRLTNAEIAERLFVSVGTVKSHLHRVYTKLSVTSRSALISRYSDEGL